MVQQRESVLSDCWYKQGKIKSKWHIFTQMKKRMKKRDEKKEETEREEEDEKSKKNPIHCHCTCTVYATQFVLWI